MGHPVTLSRDCVFCDRIDQGQYDYEGNWSVSFEPLNPVVPGHRLFVPRRHAVDARDSLGLVNAMSLASEWAREQHEEFNLITSTGVNATQSIFHLHVHYIPRKEGDGLKLPWSDQLDRIGL